MNEGSAGRRQKVLVVDDDASHREIVVAALEGSGLQVLEAEDAEAAVEIARRERPGLVFLDLQLAGSRSSGLRVLECLKREDTELRVVAYTAWALPQFRQKALSAGVDEYLAKPVDLTRLREVTARYVEGVDLGPRPLESGQPAKHAGGGGCGGSPRA